MKKLTGPRLLINSSYEAADVLYLTGFSAVDPFLLLRDESRRILLVSRLEAGRARLHARATEVVTAEDLALPRAKRRRMSAWVIALLRREKIRRVWVGPLFPVGIARRLERAGIRVRLAEEPACPGRLVKRGGELDCLRESQAAAVAAMDAALGRIRRSRAGRDGVLMERSGPLTSEALRLEIDRILLERDCAARETIVACGPASAQPHERGAGPLRAGEPIVVDIFPQHRVHGYWGDLTRTVVKGGPPPRLRAMHEAVRIAQRRALALVRPGASAPAIHRAVEKTFEERGFAPGKPGSDEGFIHSTGHGVGLDIHEGPSIGAAGPRLKKGNVITIEPGLYYPDIGGVRIEDLVEVTASGWRFLAPCGKYFEV